MKYLVLLGALCAVPASAQKSQPAALTTVASADPAQDPEKLICKKQEIIGSLIAKKRVCATARNWERNEALAKEHLEILTAPGIGKGN